MFKRILSGGALAAVAGAAMLAASATPSSALTLSAPSLAAPVASADVDHVWWDRWGRWHPNYYRPGVYIAAPAVGVRWGYWGGRRCWWDRWGYRHCRW